MARRSSSSRRILILSASVGGLHRSSGDALQRYFRGAHAQSVEVRTVDFLDTFTPKSAVLARLAYQREEAFFPAGCVTFENVVERYGELPVVQELVASGLESFSSSIRDSRPDAIIATLPLAAAIAAQVCAGTSVTTALVHTDHNMRRTWIHPSTDLIFVPGRELREDLVVAGVPYDRVMVSGVPVHDRFGQHLTREECRTGLGLADRFTALLVSTASAPRELRSVAGSLARAGVQVTISVGKDDRSRRGLEALASQTDSVRVLDPTAGMHRMMRAADLVVANAAGPSVSEALSVGLPAIIYTPVPGQELDNTDFLINAGTALLARDDADLVEKVHFLSSHTQRLKQMADNTAVFRRPEAAQTICERVLAAL